jgi:His-Xaa-Ser system radical SAM maturase HxsB
VRIAPLKFRALENDDILFADDSGAFFKSNESFLDRYAFGGLTDWDNKFLGQNGHTISQGDEIEDIGFSFRWATRIYSRTSMDYLILVPTLRCNLACGYCQVSRVNENTQGFDWTDDTHDAVLDLLDTLTTKTIKIEFQGGEPLLALDRLISVRDFCRKRFERAEFVVCTNLQNVDENGWDFLSSTDTFISTSLDGDISTHQRQRTLDRSRTQHFFSNLRTALDRFGPQKVSALPTIDVHNPPAHADIISNFVSHGIRSIYLRPVNHQGFARKRYGALRTATDWNLYHAGFIDAVIEYNALTDELIEEFYFSHCLRRIFRPGHDGHADLRNPNILGTSYLVIDFDGTLYPTDEARMVTRVGQLDLSIGDVREGIDRGKLDALNVEAFNNFHPDCVHCTYQPYCGVDLIDDLSRYGRIDLPKHLTDFCQRHTYLFDKAFELIYSNDPKVHRSLAFWLGIPDFTPDLAPAHI